MKKRLIQITEPLLKRLGLRLLRDKDHQRLQQNQTLLTELVHQSRQANGNAASKEGISFIIFSKDRALQLHGLIQSLLHHVTGTYSIHILYCASNEAHDYAYRELADDIQNADRIQWTKETDFKKDLVCTLQSVQTESVCFLVDDIVFIRPLNLDELHQDAIRGGIVSLRLGSNITFCYTKQKTMQLPTLNPSKKQDDLLKFSWKEENYDWAYPLSVDGHIFPTSEISVAAERLDYQAPNTFERALQILTPLYQKRPGYCFESPRMFNIPLNRVQSENDNISGEISPEYLLAKWQEGKTFDFMALEGFTTKSVHKEIEVSLCKRQKTNQHIASTPSMSNKTSKYILASYPRSANHWVRYIIEFLSKQPTIGEGNRNHARKDPPIFKRIGREDYYETSEPIAIKRHWIRESDDRSYKMIFIIRDYKEVIYRQLDKPFSIFRLRAINQNIQMYKDLILHYQEWPSDKIVISYEELINSPQQTITRIAHFIDRKDSLADLITHLSDHQSKCVSLYDNYTGSKTKGKSIVYYSKQYSKRWENYLNKRIQKDYDDLFPSQSNQPQAKGGGHHPPIISH